MTTPRDELEERLKDDEFALLFAEADRKADNQINRARWRCWLKRLVHKLQEMLR